MMKMKDNILARADHLRKTMAEHDADAFVFLDDEGTNWESLFYMSGFRGTSGALLVYPDGAELVLDGRYAQQGREQSPHEVIEQKNGICDDIKDRLSYHGSKKIFCEASRTFHSLWEKLETPDTEWHDGTSWIKQLRRTKDAEEIVSIRSAAEIGTKAFLDTLNDVREGMTEKEFESLLNYRICRAGGETGFDMIVASGRRSSMPHGRATDKKIVKGETVTVDYGARSGGYFCDITRNFSIGEPDGIAAELHELLLSAHKTAAAKLKAGASGKDIHNVALSVLESGGVGKYFTHSLGHSFGLEIHETPVLSPRQDDILKSGDVVTIEPGIYIEGWGGLRLEDDYLVLDDRAVRLTNGLEQSFFKCS
jgi:Xaa-Pro aminopeptidase